MCVSCKSPSDRTGEGADRDVRECKRVTRRDRSRLINYLIFKGKPNVTTKRVIIPEQGQFEIVFSPIRDDKKNTQNAEITRRRWHLFGNFRFIVCHENTGKSISSRTRVLVIRANSARTVEIEKKVCKRGISSRKYRQQNVIFTTQTYVGKTKQEYLTNVAGSLHIYNKLRPFICVHTRIH